MYPVQAVFVMQVIGGREASHADIADRLALPDSRSDTRLGGKTRHVRVQGRNVTAVLQDDDLAVTGLGAAEDNLAVTGRLDRCASWRRVIDASMGADGIQD